MAKHGLYRHNLPAVFSYQSRRKIGLLGGSFNPAHSGHIALSQKARLAGKFDQIWWLVSPQNPLKSDHDMADYDRRLAYARAIAGPYPWLRVLGLEAQCGTQYSYDVMALLLQRAPRASFTWLMGSDNLVQFPHWHKARQMTRQMPFMVMRRQDSFYASLNAKGRHYFRRTNISGKTPHLTLITSFDDRHSATALRAAGFWDKS